MENLKPCPFCGGKASMRYSTVFRSEICIKCEKCKSRTMTYKGGDFEDTKYLAIQAWNRRVSDDK